jgi:hypothetical protein
MLYQLSYIKLSSMMGFEPMTGRLASIALCRSRGPFQSPISPTPQTPPHGVRGAYGFDTENKMRRE